MKVCPGGSVMIAQGCVSMRECVSVVGTQVRLHTPIGREEGRHLSLGVGKSMVPLCACVMCF